MIDHESNNLTFITADLILSHMKRNLEYLKPSSKSNAVSSERIEIGLLSGCNMSRGFVVIVGHNTSVYPLHMQDISSEKGLRWIT